ncbi:MAG: response regulator [Anaerolineales bacterium]|jgi:DNA-binding response OmpR family regulator
MSRSILIVDASPGFAGMLQQALSSVGFQCILAHTGREAFQLASGGPVDLAIVDFHLPDGPAEELVRALQGVHPGILLLGIPPDNDPDNPVIPMLGMQGAITKPFYLPDLVPYIAALLGADVSSLAEVFPEEPETAEEATIKPPPPKKSTRSVPWLENAGKAGAWLEWLSAENSALACLITHGGELHAGAGSLSHEKLSLVARRVSQMWAETPGGAIAQYVRLPPENEEVFLYSISLALNYDLTLLFDRKTSLSVARRRAKAFEKALDLPPTTGTVRRITGELAALRHKTGELLTPRRRTGEIHGRKRRTGDLPPSKPTDSSAGPSDRHGS